MKQDKVLARPPQEDIIQQMMVLLIQIIPYVLPAHIQTQALQVAHHVLPAHIQISQEAQVAQSVVAQLIPMKEPQLAQLAYPAHMLAEKETAHVPRVHQEIIALQVLVLKHHVLLILRQATAVHQ